MGASAQKPGAGGFDLLRLFADRSSTQQQPKSRSKPPRAASARSLASSLAPLSWDPLSLNDGASALSQPVTRSHPGGQQSDVGGPQAYSPWQHAGVRVGDFEVDFPLALQLCLGLTAQPDVQLQLVSVRAGSEVRNQSSSGRSALPKADSALISAKNVATLAFLGLLFPDQAGPWLRNMAIAGGVSGVFMAGRRSAASRGWSLPRPSLRVNLSEDGAFVKGTKAVAQATHECCTAAALLGAGALGLLFADARLFHLARCLVASAALSSGYAQTARRAARGHLRRGPETQAAWRARHKWAAQRVAPLLGDLHEMPPLGGAANVQRLLSFATARGGDAQASAGVPESLWPGSLIAGLGSGEGGINVWGSVAIPRRRTFEEPDFSKPAKVGGAPAKALPSGPLQEAAARQSAAAAAAAAAAQHAAAQAGSSTSSQQAGSTAAGGRRGRKQRHGRGSAADQPTAPGPGIAGPEGGDLSAGLRTPDVEPMYATSHLLTVRSKEELQKVSRRMQQQAAAQAAAEAAGGAVAEAQSAAQAASDMAADATDSVVMVADPGRDVSPEGSDAGAVVDSASESFDMRRAATPPRDAGAEPHMVEAAAGLAASASSVQGTDGAAAVADSQAVGELQKALAPAILDSEPLAPLYGRADHLKRQEVALTAVDRAALFFRAVFLLLVFAPFLLLGVPMLLIAACLPARTEAAERLAQADPEAPVAVIAPDGGIDVGPSSSMVQPPSAPSSTIEEVLAEGDNSPPRGAALRRAAFRLLLFGCRQSGAAFIKWGQWASSRPDLLPEDLCEILTALQQDAPRHSYRQTRTQIERAFGHPIEAIFDSFEEQPLASASIAQVHKAVLRVDGKPMPVAVKVRHPGVEWRIIQDFQLLIPLARATSSFKALKGLSLEQSVSQFSNTMTAQADLRVEAAHLRRFLHNFRALSASITAPRPVDPWVSSAVLVETFQPGVSVEQFIHRPAPFNTQVVGLGVDAYLKMLLVDNFVHTDLHPGNIFICKQESKDGQAADAAAFTAAAAGTGKQVPLQMTLLDFGLAEELTPAVRHHFISFLHTISSGNGERAAELLLLMGDNALCPDREGFTADMMRLFRRACRINSPDGINVDAVLKAVLKLARKHEVAINSSYAALVLGVCVIVGFATGLDPQVNLMDAATPCLFFNDLFGRVPGRLYPD